MFKKREGHPTLPHLLAPTKTWLSQALLLNSDSEGARYSITTSPTLLSMVHLDPPFSHVGSDGLRFIMLCYAMLCYAGRSLQYLCGNSSQGILQPVEVWAIG